MLRRLFLNVIYYLDVFIPKHQNWILFASQPDFSDNASAFFKFILEKKERKKNCKIIWLVDNNNKIDCKNKIQNCTNSLNATINVVTKNSILGIWYYFRSKFVFYTHGVYLGVKIPKNHIVINLWHGMPLKNIGFLDGKEVVAKSSLAISTSKIYQDIISKSFDLSLENVLITGQPRCDLLFKKVNLSQIFSLPSDLDKLILWLPTYRSSIVGDKRVDGNFKESLPVLSDEDLFTLNSHLKSKNYYLIIKLHVMDILNEVDFKQYSNIRVVTNYEFISLNISLYELLGNIDLLLTDFSSVYIDFLLTLKPVGFLFNDLDNYNSSRGFVFENYKEYMPGVKMNNLNSLLSFLDDVFHNDVYEEKRFKLQNILHDKKKDFSLSLFNDLDKRFGFLK
jgi:CDP-glycerol glycerophosphotransferase